ncbi:MAG: Zn-ribbon containing protein [Nanoarchaeota archaeon]
MPHQCVRCSTFYVDGAKELLGGCPCGGKLFFFIKQEVDKFNFHILF